MPSTNPDGSPVATRRNLQEPSRRNHHEQDQFPPAMGCDSDVRPWMGRHHTIWRASLIGNFSVRLERKRLIRQARVDSEAATLAIRFGRSASYRARVLPPRLFQATSPAFLQPIYLPIVGCVR
jgi:hypothetical protein